MLILAIIYTIILLKYVRRRNDYNLNGDNCGHSGDRLSQNGEQATSQKGNSESYFIGAYGLTNVGIIT